MRIIIIINLSKISLMQLKLFIYLILILYSMPDFSTVHVNKGFLISELSNAILYFWPPDIWFITTNIRTVIKTYSCTIRSERNLFLLI